MSRYHEEPYDVELSHFGRHTETELAIAFLENKHPIVKKLFWVPKSVIVDWDEDTVTVAGWWAEKEGRA